MSTHNTKPITVIIQIPCFNEAATLPIALKELPRKIPRVAKVKWLIIDDGSTDDTAKIAQQHGVDIIITNPVNMGLAKTFMTGLEACLAHDADIIVNTDADNQYNAADIPALIEPILQGQAEMVVGARPIASIAHFSKPKKLLQRLGSWVVRLLSGTNIADAPSGFRAISRAAATQLHVFNPYTYTLETIIQAGHKGMRVTNVPVRVNDDLRPSRLVKSLPDYIRRSVLTMFRIFIIYSPLKFFLLLGSIPFLLGFLIGCRWIALTYFMPEPGRTYLPSLILAAILLLIGVQTWIFAFIADLMAANRQILEELRTRARTASLTNSKEK